MKMYDENFKPEEATSTELADAYIGYLTRMDQLYLGKEERTEESIKEKYKAREMVDKLTYEIMKRFLEVNKSPVDCGLCICPNCDQDCMAAGCNMYPPDAPQENRNEECEKCFTTICKCYEPKECYDDMDGGNE